MPRRSRGPLARPQSALRARAAPLPSDRGKIPKKSKQNKETVGGEARFSSHRTRLVASFPPRPKLLKQLRRGPPGKRPQYPAKAAASWGGGGLADTSARAWGWVGGKTRENAHPPRSAPGGGRAGSRRVQGARRGVGRGVGWCPLAQGRGRGGGGAGGGVPGEAADAVWLYCCFCWLPQAARSSSRRGAEVNVLLPDPGPSPSAAGRALRSSSPPAPAPGGEAQPSCPQAFRPRRGGGF